MTYCWVIVEAPCVEPPRALLNAARRMPLGSMPLLVSKRAVLGGDHRVLHVLRVRRTGGCSCGSGWRTGRSRACRRSSRRTSSAPGSPCSGPGCRWSRSRSANAAAAEQEERRARRAAPTCTSRRPRLRARLAARGPAAGLAGLPAAAAGRPAGRSGGLAARRAGGLPARRGLLGGAAGRGGLAVRTQGDSGARGHVTQTRGPLRAADPLDRERPPRWKGTACSPAARANHPLGAACHTIDISLR